MYGKIFDSMYDGTLADDWRALVTFQQLIVLCDADGVVDMTPTAISRRTGIPIEHIKAGLEVLENPDPYSRTPDEEGRRIKLLSPDRPWGWYLVNHDKYKSLKDADEVRAGNRQRKREQRERERQARKPGQHDENQPVNESDDTGHDVTDCDSHAKSHHIDTDTDFRHFVTDASRPEQAVDKTDGGRSAETTGNDPPGEQDLWEQWCNIPGGNPSERQARAHLGKLIRDYGEGAVREAITETLDKRPGDPASFVERLLHDNPREGKRPPWAVLPRHNDQLIAFAAEHDLPSARPGETYPQYRERLRTEVEKRLKCGEPSAC